MQSQRLPSDELIERYDVFLIDAYGVLVDHEGPLSGAVGFLERLRAAEKSFRIVTNDASKSVNLCLERFRSFALPIEAEEIITSGMLITDHFKENDLSGASTIVLGTEHSIDYVKAGGGVVVPLSSDSLARAVTIAAVCDDEGFPFLEGVTTLLNVVTQAIQEERPLELILCNPDLIYPKGADTFGIAAGSIALIIEQALEVRFPGRKGPVFTRLGKPHRPIFERAMKPFSNAKAVMIGDQLGTDILGANNFGIDSALVSWGLVDVSLAKPRAGEIPTFILDFF